MTVNTNAKSNSGPRIAKLVGIVFTLVGAIISSVFAFEVRSVLNLKADGLHATAEVIRLRHAGSSYAPVFTFRDIQGRVIETKSTVSSLRYAVGDKIQILYRPDEPLAARVDDWNSMYGASATTGFLGFTFLVAGVLILFFRNRFDENGEWVFGRKGKTRNA